MADRACPRPRNDRPPRAPRSAGRARRVLAAAAAALAAAALYNSYRTRQVEREHPPAGRFVEVDGVRLHYLEQGDAARRSCCSTATW